MPKIIENLQEQFIEEARRQIARVGYGAMTIRSIASECGVGTGTVYNYFASKEQLVAHFMLEDWRACLSGVCEKMEAAACAQEAFSAMYAGLRTYIDEHRAIFTDEAAAMGFSGSFGRYHALLRSQLAAPVLRFCPDAFTADFIAEAMLVWTVNEKPFEEINRLVSRLL